MAPSFRLSFIRACRGLGAGWAALLPVALAAGEETAAPLRRINLGGPAIAGWEAGPESLGKGMGRFENAAVPLVPPASDELAAVLRSSLWNSGGRNHLRITGLPEGDLTVFLYAWEDNHPEVWSVSVGGEVVLKDHDSGPAGSWRRLGPWVTGAKDGAIELTSEGGHANWSGLEIWPGSLDRHPGQSPPAPPREPTPGQLHFTKVIAPILSRHCVECHNPSDAKGDLDLTTAAGAAVAIVAGKPFDSELWVQIDDGEMPKKRPPLEPDELRLLEEWIAAGAEWSDAPVDPYLATTGHRAGYDWWSLQPVKKPPLPVVKDAGWPRNEVDRFVLARLEAETLSPAPAADLRILARRASFDLTGLPPRPEDVETLVADGRAEAYEEYVDRLLASPAFGEHWARHWLDVIRFGESQGFERNRIREQAWRYRDWVVQSFNADLPYDEFVRMQIAGDVLKPHDLDALIATGYHVAGTWDQVGHREGSAAMQRVAREEHLEDLVGTLGQTFLGLTVQCARCHDHKFDPIPQRDYFQLAALLGGVHQAEKEREGITLKGTAGQPDFKGTAHVAHFQQPGPFHVLRRGNVTDPGEVVTPRGLIALKGLEGDFGLAANASDAERRKHLASWLTDPANPLASRVIVNRLWHHVFGAGIIATPSDFGFNGERPTHPELLDWLAAMMVEEGWRMKPMIRRLITSAAYRQQSGVENPEAMKVDAGNRLLWRAPVKRLTAEQVRDAMLLVSGTLDLKPGGPSFRDVAVKLGNNHEFTDPVAGLPPENRRRTLYRLWANSGGHPLLDGLDCAAPGVTLPRRASTITPLQALSMLHDPQAEFSAEAFAKRLRDEAGDDPRGQLRRAWQLAFGREAVAEELDETSSFLTEHGLVHTCLVLINSNEFLFLR